MKLLIVGRRERRCLKKGSQTREISLFLTGPLHLNIVNNKLQVRLVYVFGFHVSTIVLTF